jgi:hypothetical protein
MALDDSPVQRDLFRALARAGLGRSKFQGGRQDSNAECRAPKPKLALQNDMVEVQNGCRIVRG